MATHEELEDRDNWQATFRLTRKPQFACLMQTIHGGYYWHYADYHSPEGHSVMGATMAFSMNFLADALKRGILELVIGELPDNYNCDPE